VGFGGTILRTVDGGTNWTPVMVNGFTSDLRSVHFVGNLGLAVSIGGSILRTQDAGQTWTSMASGTTNNLYAVQFVDNTTAYAAGTNKIIISTDAGITWRAASTDSFSGDLYGLSLKGSGGWTTGQNGLILHSEKN
jgi:photosystem II stability/assembly factor-like uncharacterized protein